MMLEKAILECNMLTVDWLGTFRLPLMKRAIRDVLLLP
jgi:hypothetical protein